MKRLSLLISTINDRIKSVPSMLLPEREDIVYVISFQYSQPEFLDYIPDVLRQRPDVEIHPIEGFGLTTNRNNALRHCHTELAAIADDDLVYNNESLSRLIEYFDTHLETDIVCCQVADMQGVPLKNYAEKSFSYDLRPKGTYFSSVEIAFRMSPELPEFDTRFGLGSERLACGEEEVFLFQAHRLGFRIAYAPIMLCRTLKRETTGALFMTDRRVRRSKGAMLRMLHPKWSATLRCINEALHLPRKASRIKFLCDMLDGMRYIEQSGINIRFRP